MRLTTVQFVLLGYLSGSVLWANVFGDLFGTRVRLQESPDQNPGTVNAFRYCGFWCGVLTLLGDLLKGFLPVFLYLRAADAPWSWGLAPVLAAPVAGHIFPVFYKFKGGKGIAVTFGCLLGLCPYCRPVLLFAGVFIFLSVVLRITPDFYRTVAAYLLTALLLPAVRARVAVRAGFLLVTGVVCFRLHRSAEEREKPEVKLLWKH